MYFRSKDKYQIALMGAVVACIVWFLNSFFYGEGFSTVLFSDQNDMFMDFFNCIVGYGGNPYLGDYPTNYPPMAVLFFQMIRNAMPIELLELTSYEMRMQQTPMMMYFFYTLLVLIIVTATYVNKVRMESEKKQLLFLFIPWRFPEIAGFSGTVQYRGMAYSYLLYFGLVFYILLFCIDDFCDPFIREKAIHRAIVISLFAILLFVTIMVLLNCFLFVK